MIEIQKQMFITTLYIVYAQIFKTTFINIMIKNISYQLYSKL